MCVLGCWQFIPGSIGLTWHTARNVSQIRRIYFTCPFGEWAHIKTFLPVTLMVLFYYTSEDGFSVFMSFYIIITPLRSKFQVGKLEDPRQLWVLNPLQLPPFMHLCMHDVVFYAAPWSFFVSFKGRTNSVGKHPPVHVLFLWFCTQSII